MKQPVGLKSVWNPYKVPCPLTWAGGVPCGEPEVSPNVGCCYDHARLCPECDMNPAFPGRKCPSCAKREELANGMGGESEPGGRAEQISGHAEPEGPVEAEA